MKPTKRKPALMLEDGAVAADGQQAAGSKPEKKQKAQKEFVLSAVQLERLTKLAAGATLLVDSSTATQQKMVQFDVPVVYARHYTMKRIELGSALANVNMAIAAGRGKASDLMTELKGAVEGHKEAETKISNLIEDMIEMGVKPRNV